jgi:hypothetical protein
MTINKKIIKQLEQKYRRSFPDEFMRYLLVQYKQEPFPYEHSEQDLYANIENDIRAYEAGELDITVKKPSELWKEEREYLKGLYAEKCFEVRNLEEYIEKMEVIFNENGFTIPKINTIVERGSY